MNRKLSPKPVPDDILTRLSDTSLAMTNRVRLAEKCRHEYDIRRVEACRLCGVKSSQYAKIQTLLRPENADLLQDVESGRLSVNRAALAVKDRSVLYGEFPSELLEKIKAQDAEIVFQHDGFCLYRKAGYLFISVAVRHEMRRYTFDDQPFVEHVLVDLIWRRVLRKDTQLSVRGGDGVPLGDVRHHIIAAYLQIPVETVVGCQMKRIQKAEFMGAIDYRVKNTDCQPFSDFVLWMPRKRFIESYDGTLHIGQSGTVVLADYSPQLELVLKKYTRHLRSRDGRLAVVVGGQDIYLHRLVMAAHRADSLPIDADGIRDLMQRFDAETQGFDVDHLSAFVQDCRLQNLTLMTPSQNQRKEGLQRRLAKLGGQYYADATRHDDKHVYFAAGRLSATRAKLPPDASGVLTVSEYLERFAAFLDSVN